MFVRRFAPSDLVLPAAADAAAVIPEPARTVTTAPAQMTLALLFVVAHIPLALAMQYGTSLLTVLHAAVTVALGVKWAIDGKRVDRVAILAAYIAGSEVLWRMTNDRLFWETGKYALVLILGLAILRSRGVKLAFIPVAYFLLLLPSAALTITEFDYAEAKNNLSFNLSGPLALMVAGCFFWNLPIASHTRRAIVLAAVAPIAGIAAIALAGILLNANITFTTESNVETSGGYGPNQVSAILGLGVLLLWFLGQDRSIPVWQRAVLFVAMAWFAGQSAMTFSRGGLYAALGGALVGLPYLLRDRQFRIRVFALPVVIYIVFLVAWPRLDQFTDGALGTRFQETELTKRGDISQSDYEIWLEHPILGVGPGVSRYERIDQRVSHTEFTRLLSEHGSLGGLALLALVAGAARNAFRRGPTAHQSLTVAMMAWATLYMMNSAMRIVAPAFVFGLAFSTWPADEDSPESAETPAAVADKPQRNILRRHGGLA